MLVCIAIKNALPGTSQSNTTCLPRERAVGLLEEGVFARQDLGQGCLSTFRALSPLIRPRLHDVGLERFDTAELFAEILLPAALLLACILQCHYFNEDFLETTSLYNSPIKCKGTSDRYCCPWGGIWRFC